MNTKIKKTKIGKCEFCSPKSAPELCKLSIATTIIGGKEFAACCVKCGGGSTKEETKKDSAKQSKK